MLNQQKLRLIFDSSFSCMFSLKFIKLTFSGFKFPTVYDAASRIPISLSPLVHLNYVYDLYPSIHCHFKLLFVSFSRLSPRILQKML